MLKLLQGIKDRCDNQAADLARLKAAGVDVQDDDGITLDDMIQREYQAGQNIERAMLPIRDRVARGARTSSGGAGGA
jgi:hypothetical protein